MNKKPLLYALQGALVLTILAVAPAAANDDYRTGLDNKQQSSAYGQASMSDSAITDRVKRSINDYKDVSVSTDNGVVRLSGTVQNEAEKELVLQKTRAVTGVNSVKDDLMLNTNKSSVGEYIDDSAITGSVKTKFLGQKGLDSLDISVSTNNGVVTLTGDVDNAAQIPLAESVAKQADGVRNVVNNLKAKN